MTRIPAWEYCALVPLVLNLDTEPHFRFCLARLAANLLIVCNEEKHIRKLRALVVSIGTKSNGYDCTSQGITSGWGDWYYKQLTGQWIDITGVPEGDYVVRVRINAAGTFDEGTNRYPNVVETPIHVPDPRKKVTIDDSPALIDH